MSTATAYLEYSDAEHRYFADGRELRSVTQILDAAGFISPFCKDEEARFRGTQVHEFCAVDDVTSLDLRKVPASLRGYLRAWRKFRTDAAFMPTLIEHRVDCIAQGYSGRFDRLGIVNGQTLLTMLDIKTAKTGAIPDYARLQLVAYAHAHKPGAIFNRMAVSLRPNGTYNSKPYPISDFHIDRAEWLALIKRTKEQSNGHGNN